jgi:hypothetical protein
MEALDRACGSKVRQPGPGVPSASTLGPAARQAIDLADMLEQMGTSPEYIRAAVHDVLKDDPSLGTTWKPHPDLDWRVERSDAGSKVRQPGPGVPSASTLGQEMTHPDLFVAEPSLRDLPFYRTPGNPHHKPPEGDLGPEIGISNGPCSASGRRGSSRRGRRSACRSASSARSATLTSSTG